MKKIGVYIDLENVSHLSYEVNFEQMLNNIFLFYKNNLKDKEIVYSIKKAYGDAKSIKKYSKKLRDMHIDIIYSVPVNKAKNMADMISSIDAFEDFVIDKKIDIVIFISRDVDYTVVMDRLSRYGAIVGIVTVFDNAKRNIFKNSCSHIFKIEDYKSAEKHENEPKKEENNIDKMEFLTFFYNRVLEIYNIQNTQTVKISISDICNKINEDFNLEKGKSAVEQTQFKKIKNVLKYLNNNGIETEINNDDFYINEINIFKNIMSKIINLSSSEISEKNFILAFKEILSNYEENAVISLANTMNEINKKFKIGNNSSAVKNTKFKKPSKFIDYIIKKDIPIELTNKGNAFIMKDKNKVLEILENIGNE
ncbi:NYN domain-containing protein [Brachyspira hampsonii]|uniref:NYN domain-containing protein n=1 Tax=Brachyspira hampsonii TaxID=1287055 RepID=A0A1E5NA98_9SPIR|nr:NYN domain-containing protein [Brachyspira hampsonii]OEJ13088.1 NYN domain-containing protein [Brachyspira hampsonii]